VSKPAQTVLKLFDENEDQSLRLIAERVRGLHKLKTFSHQRVSEILKRWRGVRWVRAVARFRG
jgi:hypothetical protein